jgi:hypothetical protein
LCSIHDLTKRKKEDEMKNILICLGVSALLFCFLSAANANLIVNGDFETVDGSIGNVYNNALNNLGSSDPAWDVYDALPGGWDSGVNDAGIEVQHNNQLGFVDAHSGAHYVELESNLPLDAPPGASNSSMSQYITGFDPTIPYVLSFWYYPRTARDNDNVIEVFFGAESLTVNEKWTPGMQWKEYTLNLGLVPSGDGTLTFRASGIDNTVGGLLDDIAVNPVPEPATMLLLGTGLVGLAGFRKKFKK